MGLGPRDEADSRIEPAASARLRERRLRRLRAKGRVLLRSLDQDSRRPASPARSSPGWTTSTVTGAGTSGSRTTGSRPTSSTSGRENALKVVARGEIPLNAWTHVFVTYDGSSQAAGVKIYIDGEPQATRDRGQPTEQHDPDHGARSRSASGTRAPGSTSVGISDVRIHRAGPLARGGRGSRRRQPRTRLWSAQAAEGAPQGRDATRSSPGG